MRCQVTVSKALNRHSEETLDLDIQIEEPKSEESRHPCAYSGLADAADASEEDAHVAPFERACQFWSITNDSSRLALGLSTRAQRGCRGSLGVSVAYKGARVRDLIGTRIAVEGDAERRFNGTFSPLAMAEASALVCSLKLGYAVPDAHWDRRERLGALKRPAKTGARRSKRAKRREAPISSPMNTGIGGARFLKVMLQSIEIV
jgi:hypothetical protein